MENSGPRKKSKLSDLLKTTFPYAPEDYLDLRLLVGISYSFENKNIEYLKYKTLGLAYLSRCIPFQGQLSTMDSVLS